MRGHKRHRPRHGEFLFILIRARAIGLTARVLLSQMGVSKAILENVVFVHQEDSNWPLGEAATLKKKFDEIFSATKYTKALEHIAKLRKEQAASIKEHKLRVENLRLQKDHSSKLRDRHDDARDKATALGSRMKELQVRLRPHVFFKKNSRMFAVLPTPSNSNSPTFHFNKLFISNKSYLFISTFIYLFHRSTTTGEDRRVQRRGELRGRRHPRAPLALGEGRAAGGQARCHRRGELAQTREPGHVRDDRPDGCARKIRRGIRHAGNNCLPTAYYFGIFIYFICNLFCKFFIFIHPRPSTSSA